MKKIFMIVAVAFAACALASCSEESSTQQNTQTQGAVQGQQQTQIEQQAAVPTKSLVECPASGYKYINAITLAEVLAPPKMAETISAPYNKDELNVQANVQADPPTTGAQAPDALAVTISGEAFKVTLGTGSVDCNTGFESQSSAILNLQSPVIAFGTNAGLNIATITELACPQFATYSEAGAVKFVLTATSVDFTTTIEKPALPEGLDLDITPKVETVQGSINAPPPGVKTETAQNPTGGYIYFLTAANWIGRIKPQMAPAGCVEFLDYWAPTTENPAANALKIEDKTLMIETPVKRVNIDLTSGIRSEAAK